MSAEMGPFLVFQLLLSLGLICPFSTAIMTSPIRRQGTAPVAGGPPPPPPVGFPAEDLLPPPALSASFPTLRPRRPSPGQSQPLLPVPGNNNIGGFQQPPRDLIPPFNRQPVQKPNAQPPRRPPPPPKNSATGVSTPFIPSQPIPLLPPIEIPPERPLTDNEIFATLVPKETSFIPTTGQGVPAPSVGITIPQGGSTAPIPSSAVVNNSSTSSSAVRFPVDSETPQQQLGSSPPRNCPSCECTNEVDYICASNGVLYLNSCSFDCATFCDAGLRKVELELCASKNQKRK